MSSLPQRLPDREPHRLRAVPSRNPAPDPREATQAWLYLGLGALALPLLALPFVRGAAWVLGAIAHELGHTAAAWVSGSPAIPRLAPGHYADTLTGRQNLFLALVLCACVARLPWRAWRRDASSGVKAVTLSLALLYPALIFTGAREVFFLFAGHGFELAFAGVGFWRAYTGGFTHSNLERAAYSVCAWLLLAVNVGLFGSLIVSRAARAEYLAGSPSGWPNDLVRVASAWGVSIPAVALFSLFIALCVLPVAVAFARASRRSSARSH